MLAHRLCQACVDGKRMNDASTSSPFLFLLAGEVALCFDRGLAVRHCGVGCFIIVKVQVDASRTLLQFLEDGD